MDFHRYHDYKKEEEVATPVSIPKTVNSGFHLGFILPFFSLFKPMHLSAFSSIQTFLSHLSTNLCHSCHKSTCSNIDRSYLSCRIGLISMGFNFIDLVWNSIWEIAEIPGGGVAVGVQIHCSKRLLDFLQSVNLKPPKPTLMIYATYGFISNTI